MRWRSVALACAAASACFPASAAAQLGHYQPGSSNIRDFFLPDPGLGIELFVSYYTSGTYRDANGDPLMVELGNGVLGQPETDIWSLTPSVSWNPGIRPLGTAYAVVISPSVANAHLAAEGVEATQGVVRQTANFGRADIMVQPVWLGHAWGPIYVAGGYAFWAPIGEYQSDAIDNIGLGFWSHQLQLSSYFFFDQTRQRLAGLTITFEVNGEQEGTGISPGNHLTLEWGVGGQPGSRWFAGLTGYAQWQVSPAAGPSIDPDMRDRVYAAGGQLSFWAVPGLFYLTSRLLFEFEARNRFEGTLGTLNLAFTLPPRPPRRAESQ